MIGGTDIYEVLAKYYDGAYAVKKDLVDLPFYLELAKQVGGPVLEIACGTGRVLLPIARAGIQIDGVDSSPAMLHILKHQMDSEPPAVRERIRLHEGDMRDIRLQRKYPLVTIPFRPMQHMHTVPDQVKALQTAAFHLDEGGILAFDVFYPKFELLQGGIGQEVLELEWPDPSNPKWTIRRFFRKDAVDKIQQTFYFTFLLRTFEGEEMVREESTSMTLCYYTYPHLRTLFLLAGLEVAQEYGSFAKAPLDNNATEMIFLLRKTKPART
jgi:SAM-dependent methyltransferase